MNENTSEHGEYDETYVIRKRMSVSDRYYTQA